MKKTKREAWAAEGGKLARFLTYLEGRYSTTQGAFLLGDTLSIADLVVYSVLDGIQTNNYDHVPAACADSYAALMRAYAAVADNEHVKAEKAALAALKA